MPSILQKPFAYLLWAPSPCKGAFLRTSFPDINSLSRQVSSIFPCFSAARTVGSCRHCTCIAPVTRNHFHVGLTTFVFKVLRNGLLWYISHAQTCDNVRVQSATEWTASEHTLHMPKPVITFVFQVLRNGLLRNILYTCPILLYYVRVQRLRNGLLRYILYTCRNL